MLVIDVLLGCLKSESDSFDSEDVMVLFKNLGDFMQETATIPVLNEWYGDYQSCSGNSKWLLTKLLELVSTQQPSYHVLENIIPPRCEHECVIISSITCTNAWGR